MEESEDLGEDLTEIAVVVKKLPAGKLSIVDEIYSLMLRASDIFGSSWMTWLFGVACRLGTVPLKLQTGVVLPIFKKGDRRVCCNYRGITLFSHRKDYCGCGKRRLQPIIEPWSASAIQFHPCWWNRGPTLCLPNQATCGL